MSNPGPNRASRCLRLAVLFVCSFLFSAVLALASPVKFDIPAQPVSTALTAFSKQSGTKVLFPSAELVGVQAKAVKGEMEPADAIAQLLDGTGYVAKQTGAANFVVKKAEMSVITGSVKGSLTGEGGKGVANVLVTIKETAQSAETDRYGVYAFPNVAAGTYVLVASAPGYQTMHIKDVNVKAGRDLTIGREEMRKASEGPLVLEPFEVHADTVEQLEKFEVTGTKQKPFADANVDIPRTINDAQPYYIFDSKTIDQSGATNVEDFLKQRLTMNAEAKTNAQSAGQNLFGNLSSINLRGLGASKTLILVNGRRIADVNILGNQYQPDVNGIPLNAIERIEVLPTSASGIYGGSAVGGVINIILKKEYVGGEARATYDNTFDTDSPIRTLSASYGMALEGGKTHLLLNASWSDAQPLLFQDRSGIFERNLATILTNSPSFIYSRTSAFLGALPNIYPNSSSLATLTLKTGGALGSRNTFVAAGTSPTTAMAALSASLLANAGSWNLDLPPSSSQSPTGLLRHFAATPKTQSFQASLHRQMLPSLEMFADFSEHGNRSRSVATPYSGSFTVPVNSPVNPFTTAVRVLVPDSTQVPITTQSSVHSATVGAIAKLPRDWTSEFDYSWSQSRFNYLYYSYDLTARAADLASGALNPFVDALLYPLNLQKYLEPSSYGGSLTLNEIAMRASGPLWPLPWGVPNLSFALDFNTGTTPASTADNVYPLTPINNYRLTYFGRRQTTESGYGELTVPLVKKNRVSFVHALELQLSGRVDHYTVDTGTDLYYQYPNDPSSDFYTPQTLANGSPFFSKAKYTSTNGTIGLKFQPMADVILRASLATAFLPPAPDQLIENAQIDPYPTTVLDPKTGSAVDVQTRSGGNPNLKPQSSKSLNAGIVWNPTRGALSGLHLDAEYYRINQNNAIGTPNAQTIVNQESTYAGRVTRDASGEITLVDISSVNLYKMETEGWDLSESYSGKTGIGRFSFAAMESVILHLKSQYALGQPEYDAANYPSEGGAAKLKGNATVTWEWRRWTVGWTTRYFSSYKQYGGAGGPDSVQNYLGAIDPHYILAQGGETIPSQTYHDIFVTYVFGKHGDSSSKSAKKLFERALGGLTVQIGLRNAFGKTPPFDAYYAASYLSPYGDPRLRSFWLSVIKNF